MDMQMPGLNGYETLREFNKTVIIIAQSAFGLSDDRESQH
jgi:CheY-like chemotaxis protein